MKGTGFFLLVLLGIMLFSGDASAKDKPKRPKVDPKPGPGGGGKIWRLPGSGGGELPADFDYAGNGLYIDPDCDYAIEGNLFWPTEGFGLSAIEAPTLEQTLAIEGNSIVGYIDWLHAADDGPGLQQPYEIAAQIFAEAAPMCATVPDDQWGDGLFAWYSSFVERITRYLEAQFNFQPPTSSTYPGWPSGAEAHRYAGRHDYTIVVYPHDGVWYYKIWRTSKFEPSDVVFDNRASGFGSKSEALMRAKRWAD